jgi:RND family efflux transporter MFP subunit
MNRTLSIVVQSTVLLLVLGGSIGIATQLVKSKPQPKRTRANVSAPLVTVEVVETRSQKLHLEAMGTVRPAQVLVVQPQVSGQVTEFHPQLVAGGLIQAGDTVVRIDERDYELALAQQRAQIARARLDLRVESRRKAIAEREWELMTSELGMTDADSDADLALRKPQIQAADAALTAARSGEAMAKLSLERTRILAPFNAVVREENVELGQVVGPGSRLATLIGTDVFWVEVAIPIDKLDSLFIPGFNREKGSIAMVHQTTAGDNRQMREGRVMRLLRDLDPLGRMARLIVAIEDPMDLRVDTEKRRLPLLIDAFVHVRIEGMTLENVAVIPRTALRDGDMVWVLTTDDTLEIRTATVAWRGREDVFVTDGLLDGDRLVISPLPAPVAGMTLRTSNTGTPTEPSGSQGHPHATKDDRRAKKETGTEATGADSETP